MHRPNVFYEGGIAVTSIPPESSFSRWAGPARQQI
jgi:hypothetical protein